MVKQGRHLSGVLRAHLSVLMSGHSTVAKYKHQLFLLYKLKGTQLNNQIWVLVSKKLSKQRGIFISLIILIKCREHLCQLKQLIDFF